jgi:hypothetical protein
VLFVEKLAHQPIPTIVVLKKNALPSGWIGVGSDFTPYDTIHTIKPTLSQDRSSRKHQTIHMTFPIPKAQK